MNGTLDLAQLLIAGARLSGINYRCSEHMPSSTIFLLPGRQMIVSKDIHTTMCKHTDFVNGLRAVEREMPDVKVVAVYGWEKEPECFPRNMRVEELMVKSA